MPEPSLVTARLLLTLLTPEDAPQLLAYRSDSEVSRYQFFEPRSLADANAFIANAAESGWRQLGIRIDGGSTLVGDLGFRLSGDPPLQAEIGVTLAPQHQGRGLATEAVESLLGHLFGELGVHRVFASVDPRNGASLALFARLGWRREARLSQSVWFKGEWADDVIFALLDTEWRGRGSGADRVAEVGTTGDVDEASSEESVVRRYQPSDRSAVLGLVGRLTEFEVPAWHSRQKIDDANHEALSRSVDYPAEGEAVFVAERGGSLAGFVHLQTKADHFTGEAVGYVADLAVHPSSGGAGVATRLLDCAADWARDEGFRLLTLDVFDGNDRARRLYEEQGFKRDTVQYTREIEPRLEVRRRPV